MLALKKVSLVLLAIVLAQTDKSRAGDSVAQDPSQFSQLTSVRTYTFQDFRESRMDRLSGGLNQRFPYRMAVDSRGRILVTDPALSVVHVFDLEQGKHWQFRGGLQQGLITPAFIAVDGNDNIYVSDLRRAAVLVFERNGQFLRKIGAGILNVPSGLSIDKIAKTLYVADWWRGQVLVFDLQGTLLAVVGTPGGGPGQLRGPLDVVIHHDKLVVLDSVNSRFELFHLDGNFRGTLPFGFDRTPIAFTFDDAENLYYVDNASGGLVAMDSDGKLLASYGQMRSFGQWTLAPHPTSFRCLAVDALGDILALRPTLNIETVRLARKAP